MIKKDKYYSVSAEVARLSGVVSARYRTKDGRFILSERDLKKAISRMAPEEFIGGVDAVALTESKAKKLIAANKYQMGEEYVAATQEEQQTVETSVEEQEPSSDTSEETSEATETEQEETTNAEEE